MLAREYSLRGWRFAKAVLADLLELVLPRFCPVCGRALMRQERTLCVSCLLSLPYSDLHDFHDNYLARLLSSRFPVTRAYFHFTYAKKDTSALLVHSLKYGHKPDLALFLGRLIADRLLAEDFFTPDMDCLVAVPLHWVRHWKRGYNQSLLLAEAIGKRARLPVLKGLVCRTRNNRRQARQKDARKRRENVEGIFRAKPCTGLRHVVLVDDVVTTGATISACAQAILSANPGVSISVISLSMPCRW